MRTRRRRRGAEKAPTRRIDWPQAWRIIASRYPPIQLFERLTPDPAVWDALFALEQLTNPRVRDEVGEIALVPPDERVSVIRLSSSRYRRSPRTRESAKQPMPAKSQIPNRLFLGVA